MKKVAFFDKVKESEFVTAAAETTDLHISFFGKNIVEVLEELKLPTRATTGSAGYDIYTPFDIDLKAGEWCEIPLGINCVMKQGWVLLLMPKSGLGFKYGMRLANTVGVIDADYHESDNDGHIKLKFTVDKDLHLDRNSKILQGIFVKFGITGDDKATEIRNGGFGSTGV